MSQVGDFGSACKVPNGVDKVRAQSGLEGNCCKCLCPCQVCSKSLGTVNFLAPECLEPEGDGSMQSREPLGLKGLFIFSVFAIFSATQTAPT